MKMEKTLKETYQDIGLHSYTRFVMWMQFYWHLKSATEFSAAKDWKKKTNQISPNPLHQCKEPL